MHQIHVLSYHNAIRLMIIICARWNMFGCDVIDFKKVFHYRTDLDLQCNSNRCLMQTHIIVYNIIYIYIEREREREREHKFGCVNLS